MTLDLNVISRQRSAVMGLAIWMILLFHSWQDYNGVLFGNIFCAGDFGVELFAALSGIGCYASLSKNSTLAFYKKRALRIIPSFLLASSIIAIFRHFAYGLTYKQMLSLVTGIAVFRGDISIWFVTYILVCYAVAPILFKIKSHCKIPILLILTIVLSVLLYHLLKENLYGTELWVLRFPAFVLGFDFAPLVLQKKYNCGQSTNAWIWFALSAIIIWATTVIFSQLNIDIKFYLFFLLCPAFLYCVASLLERCNAISSVFRIFSPFTLELYLSNCVSRHTFDAISQNSIVSAIFTIGSTVTIALILRLISTQFIKIRQHLKDRLNVSRLSHTRP